MPLVILPLLACVENQVVPTGKDTGQFDPEVSDTEEPVGGGGDSPLDSAVESLPQLEVCDLDPVDIADASGAATCGPVDAVDWDVVVEAEYVTPDAWVPYLGTPQVAPEADGASPTILSQIGWNAGGEGVVGVDASALVDRWVWGGFPEGDVDQSGFARSVEGDRVVVAAESNANAVACYDPTVGWLGEGHTFSQPGDPMLMDLDRDGVPEIVAGQILLDADCNVYAERDQVNQAEASLVGDLTGDGGIVVATGDGQWRLSDGAMTPWPWQYEHPEIFGYSIALAAEDGVPFFVVTDYLGIMRTEVDGTRVWAEEVDEDPDPEKVDQYQRPTSIGDVDGDGVPEIAVAFRSRVHLLDTNGSLRWEWSDEAEFWPGGVAMADLDADGRYEVVVIGQSGLHILDGASGRVLGETREINNRALWSYPVIADLDGDGGAEILVTGSPGLNDWEGDNSHLFVIGPASGRWARTRPVWNQVNYDITSIRDNGRIVRFPRPAWQTYNAWRAQPSHDGDHPDLTATEGQSCATLCGPGGTVYLEVIPENLGSQPAAAGTQVVLSTWKQGDAWISEVARASISEPIPSMRTAGGVMFEVPWEQWGDARVVDLVPTDSDECDHVNDRLDILEDPCAP